MKQKESENNKMLEDIEENTDKKEKESDKHAKEQKKEEKKVEKKHGKNEKIEIAGAEGKPLVTYDLLRKSEEIRAYIDQGNLALGVLGFTDHSETHAVKTAETAGKILKELGYPARVVELARIAGYLHDMGNCVNRNDHAHNGALMAFQILREYGMDPKEIAVVVSAIGEHDEHTGTAVDAVSAALILADKTDVRRNRVRNKKKETFDKHDRVNYAAKSSKLTVRQDKKVITLEIELDENICSMMDYFEIFLQRMLMCRRAAELLGYRFKLTANGSKIV